VKKILFLATIICFSINASAQSTKVKIETTMGTIIVKLYDDVPLHKNNFIKQANNKQLDSTLFHRVIKNFMIQAGDPDTKHSRKDTTYGEGDLPYKIPAEIMPNKHFHKKGVIAAARDENPGKESSACQFYIVQGKVFTEGKLDSTIEKRKLTVTPAQRAVYTTLGGTPHLDGNYTVFGEVVKGIEVVDKIAAVPTIAEFGDRPVEDIRILSVRVMRRKWLGLF
jgi:cyclophilin family peptidyl-prolyl cis-trans isomerase